jgi:hypothetical protein
MKGSVIRLNKAINAPVPKSAAPAPTLYSLSARQDFGFMWFPLLSALLGIDRPAKTAAVIAAPLAVEAVPAGMFF